MIYTALKKFEKALYFFEVVRVLDQYTILYMYSRSFVFFETT